MHNIFGQRFLSHKEPAWHGLGQVVEEGVGAAEAFERLGSYEVMLASLSLSSHKLPKVTIPYKAIVRTPVADDPQLRVFGIVSPEYSLITPQDFTAIWDEHVAEDVETIGMLGKGETMFISTRLPSFNVRGDEVGNYLLAVSPMTGGNAAEVRITPVRVVCQNTLSLSENMSTEIYRIVHDASGKERLASWLTDAYQRAEARTEAIKEAFNVLAGHRVGNEERELVLAQAYPNSSASLLDNAPPEVLAMRRADADWYEKQLEKRRGAVRELFAGAGTGMEHPACSGTAWGLFNSVCECEDYRRGRGNESICKDALFGGRAETKERAFDACLYLVRN